MQINNKALKKTDFKHCFYQLKQDMSKTFNLFEIQFVHLQTKVNNSCLKSFGRISKPVNKQPNKQAKNLGLAGSGIPGFHPRQNLSISMTKMYRNVLTFQKKIIQNSLDLLFCNWSYITQFTYRGVYVPFGLAEFKIQKQINSLMI